MGNQTKICGNIESQVRAPLNAIAQQYHINQWSSLQPVKQEYVKYPQKFPYILTQMNKKNIKFIDKYFNCQQNEQKVVGDQFYAFMNVMHINWIRVDQVLKNKNNKIIDRIKIQGGNKISSIHKVLYWIMEQPKLIKNIFRFQQLLQQGMVLIYLPYYGSQNNPVQIVIDNYIPFNNKSYVAPIPPHSTIGMLLLQKALAKLLGSYQSVYNKSGREIFEIVVGIPVIIQNLAVNQEEVHLLSNFYKPSYKISTIQQEIESKHSHYIKININKKTNISISIWQIDQNEKISEFIKASDIIMQLIKRDRLKGTYSRIAYASKLYQNKTILRGVSPEEQNIKTGISQFLLLQQGDYYLHIFSESDKASVIANIIIYSQFDVNVLFRKENNQLNEIKRAMIQNIFEERLIKNFKSPAESLQCSNVKSKFVWDGYRGIILLFTTPKNLKMNIRVEILPEYRKKVRFQQLLDFQMQINLSGNRFISFIKLSNIDIGRFYKISAISQY